MRILFVHEVDWRHKVVYEIHDFPELLSLMGHEVVFIDFPEHRSPAGLRRLLDLGTDTARGCSRAHAQAAVEVRTPGRVFAPPLDRLAASVTQVPEIARALAFGRFDAVVLYAVPTNGWQTVMLARAFGVPVLFRAIDVSHKLRDTAFTPLIEQAERFVYRNVDALSTHNEPLRQYCVSQGARADTSSIEYPGLDLERFSPGPRDPALAARYGISPDDDVILFMGTLFRFAGVDWLIRAFAELVSERPRTKLLIIGGGEAEQGLVALARELDVAREVVFTGFVDFDRLPEHLRLGSVAVTPFRRSTVTDCALPGKVMQYLGCGLPTLSTPLAGLRSMLAGEDQGVVYRELDEGFMRAAIDLLHRPARRESLARAGREAMEAMCQWSRCSARFEASILRMIEREGTR
jgi:glycosyltransferase involved in cell wall biosynthesis